MREEALGQLREAMHVSALAGISLVELKQEYVRAALRLSEGNFSAAARAIKVSRSTLYQKKDTRWRTGW